MDDDLEPSDTPFEDEADRAKKIAAEEIEKNQQPQPVIFRHPQRHGAASVSSRFPTHDFLLHD